MRTWTIWLFLLLAILPAVAQVPDGAMAALKARYPDFQPWTNADYHPVLSRKAPLFCVVADFNGDKVADVVIEGHTGDANLRVAAVSKGKTWQVYERERTPRHSPADESNDLNGKRAPGFVTYLELIKPGKDHKLAGFRVVSFGRNAVTFYYERGAFRRQTNAE